MRIRLRGGRKDSMTNAPKPTRGIVGLVCAGGVGSRLGADRPKQYIDLNGRSMLEWSVRALLAESRVSEVVVVVSAGDGYIDEVAACFPARVRVLRTAGATRAATVLNGLMNACFAEEDLVLVHDAARPCLRPAELAHLIDSVLEDDQVVGGLLAVPLADTLKRVNRDGIVEATVPRAGLWRAATPQLFPVGVLIEALLAAGGDVTDEAGAVERLSLPVKVVRGRPTNIKVTEPADPALARIYLGNAMNQNDTAPAVPRLRVGQGYDSHRLVEGRPLIVGGVVIPFEKGLDGHSDADVLLHAVTDAVLGAAGLGDIGEHFPPSEERWRGADSAELLAEIVRRADERGFHVVNCDATVIAERPRMGPHRPAMRRRIAALLDVPEEDVNIKAKTNERMDAVGAGEGMVAHVVVLMEKRR